MVRRFDRSVRWPQESKRQEAFSAAILRMRAETFFQAVLIGSLPIQVAGRLLSASASEAEVEYWGIALSGIASLLTIAAGLYRHQMRAWHVRCRAMLHRHS